MGRNSVEYLGSWNEERNAEATDGPLFVFIGTRCRYFENTSITEVMYL